MEAIIEKLNSLQCPFTCEKQDILGEKWKELICWLILKYDSGYYNTYLRDSTRLSNILQALSLIGICDPNDHQFIAGSISQQLKISSLQNFLDIILYSQSNSDEMIEQNYKRDQKLLNSVISNSSNIFDSRLQLFPTDMKPIYAKSQTIPTIQNIEKDKMELKEKLEELKNQIEKNSTPILYDKPHQQNSPKSLLIQQFQHLHSLISEFSNTYTTSFSHWDIENNEENLDIGEPTREVMKLSKVYTDLLNSIHNVKNLYDELINSNLDEIENSGFLKNQHVNSLKESINVLEKSILRCIETQKK